MKCANCPVGDACIANPVFCRKLETDPAKWAAAIVEHSRQWRSAAGYLSRTRANDAAVASRSFLYGTADPEALAAQIAEHGLGQAREIDLAATGFRMLGTAEPDQATIAAVSCCPHRTKPAGCCGPIVCRGGRHDGQRVTFPTCAACVEGLT